MAFEWFKKVKDKVASAITEVPEVDTGLDVAAAAAEPAQETVAPVEAIVAPVAVEAAPLPAEVSQPVATSEPVERELEVGQRNFASRIRSLFSGIQFDPANLDELEDILLLADFGVDASESIVGEVKRLAAITGAKTERELKNILISVLTNSLEHENRELNLAGEKLPYVFLLVGVNGVGKTTTIGKLAAWLAEGDWQVVIGAADTFRAAAVEQVATWAKRAGAKLVGPDKDGQDPASVAYTAVETAVADAADIVIIDTAGRLQNKLDLMNELGKIRRVVEKTVPVSEVLLVIDATTGQNGLQQAKAFAEVAQVTGVVLTKVDGTAKGGIVFSIQKELGIPVKLIGFGEGINDFAFFEADEFARGLVG
jgi:fused signal recognition particle receptor